RAVARGLYDARVAGRLDRLPWLLVDEAHAFFGGVAEPALRTLLTRGRAPGVSLVCATQRPGALPSVAVSQSDLLVAHRLTAEDDVSRLAEAEATYLGGSLASRLPTGTGEALVVDDATETVHTVRVRERRTPHGGGSPRASRTRAAAERSDADGSAGGGVCSPDTPDGGPRESEDRR
ncbi:ATP-binding protein, partial [Halorubrum sp. SD626R]|uniref:ATP-binding protein n=2 Tax=Halorubrum TaxID=56688 RepID=UPI003744469C